MTHGYGLRDSDSIRTSRAVLGKSPGLVVSRFNLIAKTSGKVILAKS